MREWCSPAVLRAIESARARLGDSEATAVAADHLLFALIEEEDGRATTLLARHGVHRPAIQQRFGVPSILANISVDRLLAETRALSREFGGEGTATSEYFLLAVLRSEAALERELISLGLDRVGLEREILGESLPLLEMSESIQLADTTDHMAAGRIIDVNANRARESLRILDDYCRFVLDDAFLTGEIKLLRHDLARLLEQAPGSLLLSGRETVSDVGVHISTSDEGERGSPREVARINLKRLQESLRSLEEFGKLFGPTIAEGIQHSRYRAYTLEKAIVLREESRQKLDQTCLYVLLTGTQCDAALDWTIAEAAAGGAAAFQLREKDLDDRQLLARARDVRRWTRKAGALFIMNDRPDIARLAEADGVHLGQDDMLVHEARKIVGPDALIGVSTHDMEQVRRAILDGASYIGVGPTFPSLTKAFDSLAGLEFVKQAFAETSLPAFAIGGVNLETIEAVVAAGANRVAVAAAIAKAEDPRMAAHLLVAAVKRK